MTDHCCRCCPYNAHVQEIDLAYHRLVNPPLHTTNIYSNQWREKLLLCTKICNLFSQWYYNRRVSKARNTHTIYSLVNDTSQPTGSHLQPPLLLPYHTSNNTTRLKSTAYQHSLLSTASFETPIWQAPPLPHSFISNTYIKQETNVAATTQYENK